MERLTEQTPRAVHHAMLNHIAIVSTYAYLLQDTDIDDDQTELLGELVDSVGRAHTLATELGLKLKLHAPPDSDRDPEGESS